MFNTNIYIVKILTIFMKILDIGCGNRKTQGAVGVDIDRNSQADVIYDLNRFPWKPFKDSEFDTVVCNHILEHFSDTIKFLKEIHRISKNGAKVIIRVPHYSGISAWGDLDHKKTFSANCHVFIRGRMKDYFKVEKISLHYFSYADRKRCLRNIILSKIIDNIANKFLKFSDKFLCYWIGGFQEIEMQLRVIK